MSFNTSIIKDLEDVDWNYVYPRLLRYATYKCRKFAWLGTVTFDPESIAQEAVALIYGRGEDGNYRNWDRSKCSDIIKFLKGVVDSLVSHEYEKMKTFKIESLDCKKHTDVDISHDPDFSVMNFMDFLSAADPAKELEMKENISQMVKSIRNAAGENKYAKLVVSCLEQGIGKPREIADEIGIDVTEVYQILRRLREKISK